MAYNKTTWVNNTTPIDENNLNKIEQGIYDNSLVVDAVTNTINPTDTATYKTAELTKGQITDVIGVNDIVIKGQTSQDGEPTPDSPVDVNVVSGSNVINTSNKNLFNKNSNPLLVGATVEAISTGVRVSQSVPGTWRGVVYPLIDVSNYVGKIARISTKVSANGSNKPYVGLVICDSTGENRTTLNSADSTGNVSMQTTIPTLGTSTYLGFAVDSNSTGTGVAGSYCDYEDLIITLDNPDIAYEPHQGKELPLDLPVENLFGNAIDTKNTSTSTNTIVTDTSDKLEIQGEGGFYSGIYKKYKLQANTPYIISLKNSYIGTNSTSRIAYKLGNECDNIANSNNDGAISVATTITSLSFTTDNTGLVAIAFFCNWATNTGKVIYNNIQLEQGSKANAYTPYGTDPIELCKIGNYQDYFYKSGSKWYLHKETGKVVLNGGEDWQKSSNTNIDRFVLFEYINYGNTSCISDYFINGIYSDTNYNKNEIFLVTYNNSKRLILHFNTVGTTTVEQFKTWLASNNVKLYYILATATNTEITNTTLISQLESIYNAPLYEQTNITQTNNDLPMVLDITACKDNINGIKAFIRK